MWIYLEVVVGDSSTDELTVEIVVSGVDVPDAGVRVGVAVCASTEGTIYKTNYNQNIWTQCFQIRVGLYINANPVIFAYNTGLPYT